MPLFDIADRLAQSESLWEVLHSTGRSQIALMTLAPGEASSPQPSIHPFQDQLLYLVDGELAAEIGGERLHLKAGQLALVPAGTPHRFINVADRPARTLNIYAPPVY